MVLGSSPVVLVDALNVKVVEEGIIRAMYSNKLIRFMTEFSEKTILSESSMWLLLYRNLDNPRRLLEGEFAEYLPHVSEDSLAWVVKIYHEALVANRYWGIWDYKCGGNSIPKKCPITNSEIKHITVATATIDVLEGVWEKYVNREYITDQEVLPHYHPMMARLLQISLHLQWAGFAGFADFESKWNQIMRWKHDEYHNPHASAIMRYFVSPPKWMANPLDSFWAMMPINLQEKVLTDVFFIYNECGDPRYFGEHSKRKVLESVCQKAIDSAKLDEEFKRPFREYLSQNFQI